MIKNIYDIIQRPIITEKSTMLSESRKYIFEVSCDSCKKSIKEAIEKIFTVNVTKVNIINVAGKRKIFKGIEGKRSDIKKAIVTLAVDQSIDIAGGVK